MTTAGKEQIPAPSRKPTVVLLGFTSLSVGSGTEQFLMNIARNAPTASFRVVVGQTDFAPSRRWDDGYVAAQTGNVELLTLRSPRRRFDPDRLIDLASRSLGVYLLAALAQPFLRFGAAREVRRKNVDGLRSVEAADLIYLIRNEDRDWLRPDPSRTVVVGSTHCDDLSGGLLAFRSLPGRNVLGSLYRSVARRAGRRSGAIDAYHVTQKVYWQHRLKRTPRDEFIPLGVDSARFRPEVRAGAVKAVRFLFVGGLESQKGIDLLLDAWKEVTSDRGELHIVGHGRLAGVVRDRARADPRIHVHGLLAPDTLTEMYRSCDVFVLPSRYETLGLVVLEALSSGLYVVASDTMQGVFDDFRDLEVLEYQEMSPPRLGRRLQEVAEGQPPLDDDRRRVLHEFVEAHYDWECVSAQLFDWFHRLIEAPGTPRSPSTVRPEF